MTGFLVSPHLRPGPWKIACHHERASYCYYSYQPHVILYRPQLPSSSSSSYMASCRDFATLRSILLFSFRTREKERERYRLVVVDESVNRHILRAFGLRSVMYYSIPCIFRLCIRVYASLESFLKFYLYTSPSYFIKFILG